MYNQYGWDNAEPEHMSGEAEYYEETIAKMKECFAVSLESVLDIVYGVKPFDDAELENELESLADLCELGYDYDGKELAIERSRRQSAYGAMLFDAFSKVEAGK